MLLPYIRRSRTLSKMFKRTEMMESTELLHLIKDMQNLNLKLKEVSIMAGFASLHLTTSYMQCYKVCSIIMVHNYIRQWFVVVFFCNVADAPSPKSARKIVITDNMGSSLHG